ncbi:unnamed protein product, partial [Hapterophycus canaliculatus]
SDSQPTNETHARKPTNINPTMKPTDETRGAVPDEQTTRKQTVLYNLFEWPSRRNARLVVVGIANTIDLPERCLPRVSSRVTSRLTFGPYLRNQVCGRCA